MKSPRLRKSGFVFLSATFWCAAAGLAAQQDRIAGTVDSGQRAALRGSVHPKVQSATDLGALEPETRINGMRLVLGQSDRQRADLEKLLEDQRDPSSPDYRNWLTPEQYADRFGFSENDIATVEAWLQSRGFTVEQVARGRNWITFDGSAKQVEQTFSTEMRRFQLGGETHFANATEISVPQALNGIVTEVRGLNDFRPRPQFTASNGAHYLSPADLAVIYDIQPLYNDGFDGTGQELAIAGQTDIKISDIRAFRSVAGLPASDPQLVLFGADPGSNQSDQLEADLDLEWSGAVASGATIVYVYSQNVFESLQYAVDQDLAPVVSMSYGECELDASASLRTLAQQANAEGITWLNAAGDSGAAGCDEGEQIATHGPAVTFPASIPEVTAVGGSELNDQGGNYWNTQNSANLESVTLPAGTAIPETAWNDTTATSVLLAGGGGPSQLYAKPWWQSGLGVPNDSARDVPDIALTASAAHDGYLIYAGGALQIVGGTSATSPSFAGIVTILNQYLVAKGSVSNAGLGNINPALYNLAQNTTGLFRDITSGSNIVRCETGTSGCVNGSLGYKAGAGYDLATGLGSVDAFNLVTKWTSVSPAAGAALTLSANPGTIAAGSSTQLMATVTAVSGDATPAGTVTFTSGNATLGSVVAGGSGNTATAVLKVTSASFASGSNTIVATYVAASGGPVTTATTNVVVTNPAVAASLAVTANPAAISQSGTTVLVATVKAASGSAVPAGTVAFSIGSENLGTATLAASGTAASATFSLKGSALALGANTIAATYAGAGNFSASSGSVAVTASSAAAATATTVRANPAAIATSGTTQLTATVNAVSSTGIPAGTVTFSVGGKSLGSAPLSNSSAILTVAGSNFPAGSNSIVATYQGAGNFAASTSAPVVLTVTAAAPAQTAMSLAASPAAITQNNSTVLTATVTAPAGAGGPAGSVSFSARSVPLGSAPVAVTGSSGTAIFTIPGSSLPVGTDKIAATYIPEVGFASSSASINVTVTAARIAAPTIATATTVSVNSGASNGATFVLTATVKAGSGSASPAGNVYFSIGTTELGVGTLEGTGGTATATLTLNSSYLAAGTIEAYYPPNAVFASSIGSVAINIAQTATRTGQ